MHLHPCTVSDTSLHSGYTSRRASINLKMWLSRQLNGTCGSTNPLVPGDCSSDDKGLFKLPPAAYASWQAVIVACSAQCVQCARCEHPC